jgi:hypothetical protein
VIGLCLGCLLDGSLLSSGERGTLCQYDRNGRKGKRSAMARADARMIAMTDITCVMKTALTFFAAGFFAAGFLAAAGFFALVAVLAFLAAG